MPGGSRRLAGQSGAFERSPAVAVSWDAERRPHTHARAIIVAVFIAAAR
jgi:hypothetical protein